MTLRARLVQVAVLLFAGVIAACGGGGGGTVDVTVQEYSVTPEPTSVPSGTVTFNVENLGPNDLHEFVVVRSDLAPDVLPTTEEGAVDEEGEGVELIGEIEEFPVGETRSVEFDLDAGNYVLFCNLVVEEEGEVEAHYSEGMRVGFTVEG